MGDIIGKTLGKYTIVKSLGQGGMGEVYLATQAGLDRSVALKLLKATVPSRQELERFRQEARSLALLDHPNIIQVFDYDVDPETNRPYIVFKFIEGETLEAYLTRLQADNRMLESAEVEQIISDLCAALSHAHQKGVVHRDIKPGNVMRDKSGRLILTDFGLARLQADAGTTSGIIGTWAYISPERLKGEKIDGRADLYALGVMLYRLLAGQLPFPPQSAISDHLSAPVPDPRITRPDLSPNLARFVMKCMAKSPGDRCRTADEFLAEFRAALANARPSISLAPGLETQVLPMAQAQAIDASPGQYQEPMPPAPWDRGVIRQLLNDAFDDEELAMLCYDHFAEVYERFGEGMTKPKKILVLIDYCHRHNQFELLIEAVKRLNPAQYAKYGARLRVGPERTPPPSEKRLKAITAPFLAPRELAQIVGRETEVGDIVQALTGGDGNRICCLTGMGGIGKTSLATRVAHQLREHFTDGVLWGDVYHSEPLTILDTWARAFGCDFSGLPDLDSRAAAMRNVLSDKRVLVVLDDVWSADRARPLLPNGDECAVLITTRDVEVAAALNLAPYMVEALSPFESYQLMANILRNDLRLAAEKPVADEICALLAHLPLAVEIAAQRMLSRPSWKLADMAQRLRDEHTRLGELKVSNRAVRASFELSWNVLDDDQRRSFAALGVFEGRTFTALALAAIAEQDELAARGNLDSLVVLSLLDEEGATHYHQHPLLADFACEKLEQQEAAYARMAQYYLSYAQERKGKYAELEAEWSNIWAGLQAAYRQKMWQGVLDYSDALKDMWFARGYYTNARKAYAWAVEAAQTLDNRQSLAESLLNWGRACIEQEDYVEAERLLLESLRFHQELMNLVGIASSKYYLGRSALEQEKQEQAQQLLAESKTIREQIHDTAGIAETLFEEARLLYRIGDYAEVERLGRQALEIQETVGDRHGLVRTLRLLADTASDNQLLSEAEQFSVRALTLSKELQDKGEQALILETLSHVHRKQGQMESALECAQQSLDLLKNTGDRGSQAMVLDQLGMVYASKGQPQKALEVGHQSLALSRELQDVFLTACVLLHNGDYYQEIDQPEQAQAYWHEALEIALRLQHPALIGELRRRIK